MGWIRPGRDQFVLRLLSENPEIAELEMTGVAAPVQYEGRLHDGRHLYFRHKWGTADLGFGDDMDAAVFDPHAAAMNHGDSRSGVFEDDDTESAVFGGLFRERFTLDQRAAEALARAGWSPARRVDPAPDVAALAEHGYRTPPDVREFLASFSGVRIELGDGSRMVVSAAEAVLQADHHWCACYSAVLRQDLVPVGRVADLTILVDPSVGQFWGGGVDDTYGWLGDSFHELVAGQLSRDVEHRLPRSRSTVPNRGDGLGVPPVG